MQDCAYLLKRPTSILGREGAQEAKLELVRLCKGPVEGEMQKPETDVPNNSLHDMIQPAQTQGYHVSATASGTEETHSTEASPSPPAASI